MVTYEQNRRALTMAKGSNEGRYIKRDNPDDWIIEAIVSKVGKKYLTVKKADYNFDFAKFDMTDAYVVEYENELYGRCV